MDTTKPTKESIIPKFSQSGHDTERREIPFPSLKIKREHDPDCIQVTTYTLSNLHIKYFHRDENGFVYSYRFKYKQSYNLITIKIMGDDFKIIFNEKNRTRKSFEKPHVRPPDIKIQGWRTSFSLTFIFKGVRFPIHYAGSYGHLEFEITSKGKLGFSNRPQRLNLKNIMDTTKPVPSSKSAAWSIKHPYQGGSFSPK